MNAVMNWILIITLLYALIEAVNAANRVNQKRRSGVITHKARSRKPSIAPQASRTTGAETSPQAKASPAVGLPVLLDVNVDTPLATSISVSGSPGMMANDIEPAADLVPDNLAIPEAELNSDEAVHAPEHHEHPTILEEIAQLGQAGQEDVVAHFARYLDHPDSTIRVAAVFELGELTAKRRDHHTEEISARLRQISQEDADPDVRAQAIAALDKVQAAI